MKEEQEIAEACNRLIRNSIICWNYLYLSRRLAKAPDGEMRENLLDVISSHSPMSWAHVNMLGEYDFSDEKLRDALGILPPPESGGLNQPRIRGVPNQAKLLSGADNPQWLCRLVYLCADEPDDPGRTPLPEGRTGARPAAGTRENRCRPRP